uniref:Uncharacterized protein n=1 Tax=Arundo donax TaxID=35708 RepID=A0A0A9D1I1_ARUDO
MFIYVKKYPSKKIQKRTVQEGLTNCTWVSDIQGALTVGAIIDYLHLWDLLSDFTLQVDIEDKHIWQFLDNTQPNRPMRAFFLEPYSLGLGRKYGRVGHLLNVSFSMVSCPQSLLDGGLSCEARFA